MTIAKVMLYYFFFISPLLLLATILFYKAFALWYKNHMEKNSTSLEERKMSNGTVLRLPFGQDVGTVRRFEFLKWRFCFNRARPCDVNHSKLLHGGNHSFWPIMNYCYGLSLEGRAWISHKTKPTGSYVEVKNINGTTSYIHRITACVRNASGVNYLQLIFFSWWVAVVRKDDGMFAV